MATTQIKNGYRGGSDDQLLVNPDGSINVNGGGSGGGNASVGPTGTTAPASATEVGAVNPSGNLTPLTVDNTGALLTTSTVSGSVVVSGNVTTTETGLTGFQTTQYVIGLTAVQITPTPLSGRVSISLKVTTSGNSIIYIGNSSSVTTTTGFPMVLGDNVQMDLTPAQSVYAISDTAGQTLYALEIG